MSDDRPRDHYGNAHDGYPSDPEDLEVLFFGAEGPELTSEQAERNTELLMALAGAARDCGVAPTFLQLPAAPPAVSITAAPQGRPSGPDRRSAGGDRGDTGGVGREEIEGAFWLRMGVRTRAGAVLGRIDFLNAVLRLAGAYQLGMYVGESTDAGSGSGIGGSAGAGWSAGTGTSWGASGGAAVRYRPVLAQRASSPGPDARPDLPRRPEPPPRARHRVIDLTVPVPVPASGPLNGSLMVTVVGPVDDNLADGLARIAAFLDDHRVGCHAASASMLQRTLVLNLVLAVLPNAPVDTVAFAEILRSGLSSDPVWPTLFRPTLLDPVATR